jgi:hypothetical protein
VGKEVLRFFWLLHHLLDLGDSSVLFTGSFPGSLSAGQPVWDVCRWGPGSLAPGNPSSPPPPTTRQSKDQLAVPDLM